MQDDLPDIFPHNCKLKYIVIVTETKMLDDATNLVANYTRRGIYSFTDKDAAISFKTSINRANEETIAYLFINPERK